MVPWEGMFVIPFPSLSQSQFEVFPHGAVNKEVRGGVDNEEPVVEAGQAWVIVGGGEGGRAPEHLIHHEELCTVEDDPGDVTEEEDHDNADKDSGQVHLTISALIWLCVGESKE